MTKPSNSRNGIDRRSLLKYSVAGGAALATGTVYAPAVHAQAKPIKLGYVSPQTGPLAAFAEADNFVLGQFREAMKGGLKIGNATRPVEVSVRDSQSNPNRAAEVAKELIVRDKVDLMLVASTPETTNPVCTQCEIEEVACVSTKAPWQPWFIGQQANPGGGPPAWKPFNYVYHYFWGLEDVIAVFTNTADRLYPFAVRGGHRRAQAQQGGRQRQGDGGGHRRHQPRHRRRQGRVERQGRAPVRRQERDQDAAGGRPMAHQGRQQVRHRHHGQPHRAGDPGGGEDGGDRVSGLGAVVEACAGSGRRISP
jgi:Periplasmic binding protein